MEAEHSSDKMTMWQPQPQPSEILGWLVEQVTILAEAKGESMTSVRLKIYAANLADLGRSRLEVSFTRALRELKFFPQISELRELAGAAAKDQRSVEAEAAWKFANDYLRKWGVDLMPLFKAGAMIEAPALPQRIDYALRRIGGLRGLNQATEDSRPFMFKDFCEAYNLAPIAEELAPQLARQFGAPLLKGSVKQLTDGKAMERRREAKPVGAPTKPKAFPAPAPLLTPAQCQDRRYILQQQAEQLKARSEGTGPATKDFPDENLQIIGQGRVESQLLSTQ